jgi:hypothetical protein
MNTTGDKPAKIYEDIDATTSQLSGISGFLETGLRRFRLISFLLTLIPLYLVAALVMGISATPGVIFFNYIMKLTLGLPDYFRLFLLAWTLILAFFIYGFTLIFVVPFFNFIMPFRIKAFRGGYYSISSVPWYIHNALTYIVRYTFLEFITPTPLNPLFYRLMGMKIGKGVHINTTNISDPALIEIGDGVTIGGSAHIVAHYASKGYLIVEPVKIGKKVTIGMKATIMGDVEIGNGAVIAPHEIILPKSRIPANRKPNIQPVK